MALLLPVRYPGGERELAVGYPDTLAVIRTVPRGPEACVHDELELGPADADGVHPVRRVVSGPRRATLRVRLDGADPAARDAWLDAREADGWWWTSAPGDPDELWLVREPDAAVPLRAAADAPPGDLAGTVDAAARVADAATLAALGARVLDA